MPSVTKKRKDAKESSSNQRRHEFKCSVCGHPERAQIERDFIFWVSVSRIAKQHSLTRDSIYRHAQARDLVERRRRNVRAALEKIIEKAGEVEVNAAAV